MKKINLFYPLHVIIIGGVFLTICLVDVLIKEHKLGRGPIIDSFSIMSPGGKFFALAFLVALAWLVIGLPIRSLIHFSKNRHANRENRK